MTALIKLLESLPPEAQHELFNYAQFLQLKFHKQKKTKSFKLDWAGDLKGKYNSVQLQHEINNLWNK